jgi:periplasmic copper chaperone A
MRVLSSAAIAAFVLVSGAATARAHVSLSSGPAFANKSQKITFGVGHGCEGADTASVRVDIPAGITSVRAMTSDFGKPMFIKDVSNNITAVVWTKADAEVLPEDLGFYDITLRARVADVPFTTIVWKVTQTCKLTDGTVLPPVVWEGVDGPALKVVPARLTGWNKFVVGRAVVAADLPGYFGDAQIVWRGAAAYSPNANIMAQIGTTAGVTVLNADLAPNDEIWVKY